MRQLLTTALRTKLGATLLFGVRKPTTDKVMKEIGGILHMTSRTVAYHKYRIMEILGAKSNAELVRYAVRNKMVVA